MNNHTPYRNHPEILELYNDRVCTEISMETGGFCNSNQVCVIPDTPGNISSVCPNQIENMFSSREMKEKKEASTKSKKEITEGEGRLVGTSTLHTFTTSGPLRYPWTCSLKTRGFRCWKRYKLQLRRKPVFSGVDTYVPSPSFPLLQEKPSLWQRPIATSCARTAPTQLSFAAVDHLTRETPAERSAWSLDLSVPTFPGLILGSFSDKLLLREES